MTPDQMRAVAAKLREDNPEVNAAMTANGRAASVTIHALADAIEKVAEETVVEERELVRVYTDTYECTLCGFPETSLAHLSQHFAEKHPRHAAAFEKEYR